MYTLGDVIEAYGYDYGDNANTNIARLFDIAGAFDSEYISCIFDELSITPEVSNLTEILRRLKDQTDSQARAGIISDELVFQSTLR